MSTTDAGRLGESKVMTALVEQGWYPFVDISGKCPVDILAWRDGRCISVQVKATAYEATEGAYTVQIGTVRPNRSGNVVKKFDSASVDYLAVYIAPLDKVCFIPAEKIETGRAIVIREVAGARTKWVVSDYLTL